MLPRYGFVLLLIPTLCLADAAPQDPCAGMLSVLNRPTVGDSVCVVKPSHVIVEMGAQYRDLYPGEGHENNLPDAQFRFGLPWATEFTILPPSYVRQYGSPAGTVSGNTATVAGFKHQFQDLSPLSYSAEILVTFPTGDRDFGSDGYGAALNGILNYAVTSSVSLGLMVGVTTATTSESDGGGRYNSFNPDLILTWQCLSNLQLYAEVYGQTKTGPGQSNGFNGDTGIQYLLTDHIELDVEYGQRFNGQLDGFARYVGAGAGFMF